MDAHVHHDFSLDSRDGAPHMSEVVSSVTGVAISRYSFETIELFREHLRRLQSEAAMTKPIEVYTIGLRFSQMPEESDRRFFNSVPTQFHLPSATVDRLRGLAATQLAANPEFRRLVGDLRGQPGTIEKENEP